MSKRARLVLIDGNSVFHRGYHAIPGLTNSKGTPTAGIYGFATMVLKMLPELKPDYVIVAWDKAKTSTRSRLKMYPEYKAQRKEQPDDFYSQIPLVFEFVDAMGWPLMELDDYEADDIIGTMVTQAHKQGLETIIVTSDMDALQLLNDHTRVYASRKGLTDVAVYDLAALDEKYGLTPAQFLDYKALRGDSSDNIPGVRGVGEKTALDLLHEYSSLDGVYGHIDQIKGALHDKLVDGHDMAYLSKKLATIMCDAPVKLEPEKAKTKVDKERIHKLFRELEFKSLLTKLPAELALNANSGLFDSTDVEEAPKRPHLNKVNYKCIQNHKDLEELVAELKKQTVFAFDTETNSLDVVTAKLVGMSFCFKEGEAYYVPVGHQEGEQLKREDVIKALKPVLEDPKIGKIGHNIKFDYQIMRGAGVTLGSLAYDTMIASFLVNPLGRAMSLDDLAYRELGIEMIPITELIGTGKTQTTFDTVPVETAATYAAEDADMTWRVYQKLVPELKKFDLDKLAGDMEWPLIPILAEMELTGVELDTEILSKFNKVISKRILELEQEIYKQAGMNFNINAPAQLSQVLFGKLELVVPGVKKGKTGALSTAAKELEKMRGMHPIIELIFEYRELVKLKNTYVDALPELVSKKDGRVHTSYSQVIAQTGRLSSNNPNLQNIPVRTELGREVRKAFVAPKGRVFVSADYSQIELRVAAALSKDAAMIKAFKEGIDIHQQTASELFDVPLEKVTKEQRYAVKAVNFGVLYGMGAHALAQQTGMTNQEAVDFIKRYYELRPKLKAYIERVKLDARKDEYVSTLFGRRRPCAEINSNNFIVANAAERMAVNVPIQGTAADIMKLAMIALDSRLATSNSRLLLQIHDELIVECDEKDGDRIAKLMKETMENVYDLGVPIAVDTNIGKNWGELK